MFYKKCGSKAAEDAEFCQKCGIVLLSEESIDTTVIPKKKLSKKRAISLIGIAVVAIVAVAAIVITLAGKGVANKFPDELVYKGSPVHWLLGKSLGEVTDTFGEADDYEYYEEDDSYAQIYGNLHFTFNSDDFVEGMWFYDARMLSINGVTLDKTFEELRKILGEPDYDDLLGYDDNDRAYYMNYYFENYSMTFKKLADGDTETSIFIFGVFDEDEWLEYDPANPDGEGYEAFDDYSNDSSNTNNQSNNGIYTLNSPDKKTTPSGNVYAAPLELLSAELIQFVNILNPEKVGYGCKIQIVSSRTSWGSYETYKIYKDGGNSGTVYTVVDAVVVG